MASKEALQKKILRRIKKPCFDPVVNAKIYDHYHGDDYFQVTAGFYLPLEYLGIPEGMGEQQFAEYVEGDASAEIDELCLKLIRGIVPDEDFTWSLEECGGLPFVTVCWKE